MAEAITTVVKIGGNVIDDPVRLDSFLNDFAKIAGRKILVHGGGKEASRLSRALGIEPNMVGGRRVTDRETLDVVTMVYAGLINKRIVAKLQALACDAVGLTGADGNSIPASIRPKEPVDYGFVGDIADASVNTSFITSMLDAGRTPVFCAICHDREGTLLNCNADSVASAVATGLSAKIPVRLVYCFEKPGVMADVNDPGSVISLVTPSTYPELKEKGIVAAGMLPKLENALRSSSGGVKEVRICDASALLTGGGTTVRKD